MKKFMLVLTVAAVLFGAFALTGCNGKNATESYRNVYLVSAIAGANYLQQSADASDFYAGVSADGSYFASARVGASGLYPRFSGTFMQIYGLSTASPNI